MFKKLLLALGLVLGLSSPTLAQNVTCPTRPNGDNSNACASTAFVNNEITFNGITVGTTPVNSGNNHGVLYNNAGILGNPSWLILGNGFFGGSEINTQQFTLYTAGSSTDNGVLLGKGTGPSGEGGATTYVRKNAAGGILNGNELGFTQAFGFDGTAFNTGNPPALVFAATENWSGTAHGTGVLIQAIANTTATAQNEACFNNGLTLLTTAEFCQAGQGLGTVNAKNGVFDGGNRVISPSNTILTANSVNAFVVGKNGATNPTFKVDTSAASAATGWSVTAFAAAGGAALQVISSGTNENGSVNAKGSGLLAIGNVSTGGVQIGAGGGGVFISTDYGGSSAGSTKLVQGTSNGSPSSAFLNLQSNAQFTSIGNTSPKTYLDINANLSSSPALISSTSVLKVQAVDGGGGGQEWLSYLNGASNTGNILVGGVANGTSASPTATQNNSYMFNLRGYGYNSGFQLGSIIIMRTDQNWGVGAQGSAIDLYTTPNGSTTVTRAVIIQGSGGVSIGATTDPGVGGLYVNGATITLNGLATDATHTDRTVCQDTTSKSLFFGSGAAGICLGTSSARYKRDIEPLNLGLAEITHLVPKSFYYLPGYGDDGAKRQYGLVAEDVVKVIPSIVGLNDRGQPNSVDWAALTPVMINAIAELNHEVQALKKRKAR